MAITFAQLEKKVVIIDADLRKPRIYRHLSIDRENGLSDLLCGLITIDKAIKHCPEHRIDCITSGQIPPNPAELLGSEPMAEFLQQISRDYDYVIIDTPPLNVVSDALPIIRESDGVVIVVRANGSTHPEVQKVMESLEFIDAKVLGFIYNFAEDKRSRYSRYKYGYDYGYGYGYGYDAGAE